MFSRVGFPRQDLKKNDGEVLGALQTPPPLSVRLGLPSMQIPFSEDGWSLN